MARLHEYQAKKLLSSHGFLTPRGGPAATPQEAGRIARELGKPVVIKIQAWTTGRKAMGGVTFADTPEQAEADAKRLLAMTVGNFPVTAVLVEEQVGIARELFVSLTVDDRTRAPVILLSLQGGTGIEDRAGEVHRLPCDAQDGPDRAQVLNLLASSTIDASAHEKTADAIAGVFTVAKTYEARALEINPLVITDDGRVMAIDCRMTIDDYAVFRHPELGIDIARELDHAPTALERVAYDVEQSDHRGTFYFAQMNTQPKPGSKGLIGFHGAGGGGSMMSMDAIEAEGFTIANFTDTSGNPSASKVYRAARIILTQPDLVGYFGSGSGVASQEQFWSAYGLAKAFWELNLDIPAVVRVGGNSEDRAVQILHDAGKDLPAAIEGYRKDDPPRDISRRFATLVVESDAAPWQPRAPRVPGFVGSHVNPGKIPATEKNADAEASDGAEKLPGGGSSFPITGGRVWIDSAACDEQTTAQVVEQSFGLLKNQDGKPALAVSEKDVAGKDSELIALEVELRRLGKPVVFVALEVPGLDAVTTAVAAGQKAQV